MPRRKNFLFEFRALRALRGAKIGLGLGCRGIHPGLSLSLEGVETGWCKRFSAEVRLRLLMNRRKRREQRKSFAVLSRVLVEAPASVTSVSSRWRWRRD